MNLRNGFLKFAVPLMVLALLLACALPELPREETEIAVVTDTSGDGGTACRCTDPHAFDPDRYSHAGARANVSASTQLSDIQAD